MNAALQNDGPVVQAVDITLSPLPAYDTGLNGVSFTLQRGDLALVLLEHGATHHPLPDLLCGLIQPEQGTLNVFGQAWATRTPDQQARARHRIGRVFDEAGWLSNLDVDENITLAERHHTARPSAEIHAEAEALARLCGLDALPSTRPAVTVRDTLRRAEWVRAALGNPWLVILERPGRDLADGWLDHLLPLLHRLREDGTAILWLDDPAEGNAPAINPSLKLRAEAATLRPITPS